MRAAPRGDGWRRKKKERAAVFSRAMCRGGGGGGEQQLSTGERRGRAGRAPRKAPPPTKSEPPRGSRVGRIAASRAPSACQERATTQQVREAGRCSSTNCMMTTTQTNMVQRSNKQKTPHYPVVSHRFIPLPSLPPSEQPDPANTPKCRVFLLALLVIISVLASRHLMKHNHPRRLAPQSARVSRPPPRPSSPTGTPTRCTTRRRT